MTLAVLQATKIGIVVNRLRKTSADSRVVEASTLLVKRWNKLLTSSSKIEDQKKIDKEETSSKGGDKVGKKTTELTKGRGVEDAEAVREHCARLLGEALEANTSLAADCRIPAHQLAREIEQEIFQLFKETSQKYRSQVRKTCMIGSTYITVLDPQLKVYWNSVQHRTKRGSFFCQKS
jgi:hypothetical protein